jgi:hypothetical protein
MFADSKIDEIVWSDFDGAKLAIWHRPSVKQIEEMQ